MKKTTCKIWFFKPNADFHRLLRSVKIAILLVVCGLGLTAWSPAPGSSSTGDQQQKVTGRIVDGATGDPMPGVNIIVKGTNIGAIADADGKYSLNVPDKNATLQFSFIGYVTAEVLLEGKTVVDVHMVSEVKGLEEVVVTGYGTTKKASLTGSVAAVNGDNLKQSPVTNLTNSLIGRIPGITSIQRSGEPGYDAATFTIRGNNTLGDNSVLVVVDGIPHRDMDRIDPSDIESLTVLKDASAAIYGTQAANGVILITTKRGRVGKPTITFNLSTGFNQPTVIPDMADAATYSTMLNEIAYYANTAGGRNQKYSDADIQKYKDGSDPWGHPNTDWFGECFKKWSAQNYQNISISGGTDNMKYYLSLGTKYEDAYYKHSATSFRQYDFRTNIDGRVSKNIDLSFDVSGREENRNFPTVSQGNIFRMLIRGKPNLPAYWPNGLPGPDIEYGFNPVVVSTDATGFDHDRRYILESNVRVNIKIPWIKGLSVQANGSYDKIFKFEKVFNKPWYLYTWDGVTYGSDGLPALTKGKRGFDAAQLTQNTQDGNKTTFNAFATYETSIASIHNIKVTVGTEAQSGLNDYMTAFRKNYVTDLIPQLFAGAYDQYMTNDGWADQNARLSYFGRFNYNYSNKYLAELVMRYDGSYMFKPGKNYGFFPGVSLGWRISDENFFKDNVSFINDLKLRASYGQTGNDRIYYGGSLQEYQFLSTYSFTSLTYTLGQSQANKRLFENVVPNPDVTWEKADMYNLGFDATLLKNTLTVNADLFYNHRTGILWQASAVVPSSTGMSLPPQNIGIVNNKGFEVTVGYRNHTGDLYYDLSYTGSYAYNEVAFTFDTPGIPAYQKNQGKPMNTALNYVAIGIFKDDAQVSETPHWAGARPGDIIFKDVNNDQKIDGLDKVRETRNETPRFVTGFNANLSYKQFDMAILFQGAFGAIQTPNIESGTIGDFYQYYAKNRWTPENTVTSFPRSWERDNEYWRANGNTFWEFRTDYVRLKTLEVGYSLPASFNTKLGVEKIRLYLSGQNLLTFSKLNKLFDPEIYSGQSYSPQRVVNGGLVLTF
jgi:TonB-dependent starch-binding outer membrane protein SusC